jgi:hypothetical protein
MRGVNLLKLSPARKFNWMEERDLSIEVLPVGLIRANKNSNRPSSSSTPVNKTA